MDFGEQAIDGLVDKNSLKSGISLADLRKIRLLAAQTILNEGRPLDFQKKAANELFATSRATVELRFEVGYLSFKVRFIVKTNLLSPLIRLLFLPRNSFILGIRKGVLSFTFFSMQLKHATTRTLTLTNL